MGKSEDYDVDETTWNFLQFIVFWDVAPCSHVEVDRRFKGAYCVHYQGDEIHTLLRENLKSHMEFLDYRWGL
jgi:hypothetical protein